MHEKGSSMKEGGQEQSSLTNIF
ncbi:hypothetical protein B566_EDAN011249, partial [Ephemera danica]